MSLWMAISAIVTAGGLTARRCFVDSGQIAGSSAVVWFSFEVGNDPFRSAASARLIKLKKKLKRGQWGKPVSVS